MAVLTIGAVSASDDVASDDNLAASDEDDSVSVSEDDKLGELTEDDVDIEINDIDTSNPSENFTTASVKSKEGDYVICTNEGEDTVELFREGLADNPKASEMDEEGFYSYDFSYDDIKEYIQNNFEGASDLQDLVDNGVFSDGDVVYFVIENGGLNVLEIKKSYPLMRI